MKKIILFIFSFFCLFVNAQNANWLNIFGETNVLGNYLYYISEGKNGNIYAVGEYRKDTIVIGNYLFPPVWNTKSYIAYQDSAGGIIWAISPGVRIFSILPDINGDLLISGDSYNDSSYFFGKITKLGIIKWMKSLTYPILFKSLDIYGKAILGGVYYDSINVNGFVFTDTCHFCLRQYVCRIDSNGNILWGKKLDLASPPGSYKLSVDKDNNIFIANYNNFSIVKTDQDFNIIWTKVIYGGFVGQVKTDTQGSVFMSCHFTDSIFVDNYSSYDEFGGNINTSGKGALFKLDGQGNIEWVKTLSEKGDNDYFGFYLNNANEVIMIGNLVDTAWVADTILVKTRPQVQNGMNEMFVLKLNENGKVVWDSRISAEHYIVMRDAKVDMNNNINIIGEFEPPYIITNSDSLSCTGQNRIFVTQLVDKAVPLSSGLSEIQPSYFEIYPNPSSGIFTINLRNCRDAKICIYDVLGNCLLNKDCRNDTNPKINGSTTLTMNLSNQPKGIYFMEIVSDGERAVKKIVLQ